MRYLAKISGLYPDDPILAARVDAAMDQETDAFMGPTVAKYSERFGIALDEEAKGKSCNVIASEVMPRHLAMVERLLQESPTGWIAGTEEPSPADFMWYCRFVYYLSEFEAFSERLRSLEDYPCCKQFVNKVASLNAVKDYYANKSE